jgi:hypothetical protein
MVAHGYDLVHHLPIQDTLIESQSLPVIAPAFNQGSPLRLPRNSTAPDLPALAQSLNLKRTGSLLAIPVLATSGQPLLQVIMLSPSSSRRWSSSDEQRLAANSIPLAHILQRNHEIAMVQAELVETRLSLQSTQERMAKVESDRNSLIELVSLLQPKHGDQSEPGRLDSENGQTKSPPPDLEGDDPATTCPAQFITNPDGAGGAASDDEDDGDGWVYEVENKPPPAEG